MITKEKAIELRKEIEKASALLSDNDALNAKELYPKWVAGKSYALDTRVRYEDKLYKCVQAHTSQTGWEPYAVPALWVEVAKPGEIPVWKQPAGAHDAYMSGDKVHYPTATDPVYVSIIDNNVWAPDVYGWELVSG